MDKRSHRFLKNVVGSVFVKGWAGVVQLLLVPLLLLCLGQYENGIWMTLSSILLWIDSFDMGLGNGLRNKLATYVAREDWQRAGQAVSTTFFALVGIVVPLIILLLALFSVIDIYQFLNVDDGLVSDLYQVIACTIVFVGTTLILKIVGNIYLALQLPAVNNALVTGGQTLGLVGIFVAYKLLGSSVSLLHVAIIYTAAPILVYLVAMPITFHYYKALRISWRKFNRSMVRELFSLGIQFFVLQISGMILFATSNIIISKMFSPADVTPYQVSYRYFWILMTVFTVISVPLWSATTDAYTRGDWTWIRQTMRRMQQIMLGFAVVLVAMFVCAPYIYKVWVGSKVIIPTELSLLMAVYVGVIIYSTCYSNVLFGIGKIRLIVIVTICEAIAFIPIAIFLGRLFGVVGIIAALTLVNVACAIINRIQFAKLAAGNDKGIWGK